MILTQRCKYLTMTNDQVAHIEAQLANTENIQQQVDLVKSVSLGTAFK